MVSWAPRSVGIARVAVRRRRSGASWRSPKQSTRGSVGRLSLVQISQARADDVAELARLLHLDHLDEEPCRESVEAFAVDLAEWWAARRDSHRAFVAGLLGRGWLAWPGSRLFLASRGRARPTGCPRISRPSSSCPSTGAKGLAPRWCRPLRTMRNTSVSSTSRSTPAVDRCRSTNGSASIHRNSYCDARHPEIGRDKHAPWRRKDALSGPQLLRRRTSSGRDESHDAASFSAAAAMLPSNSRGSGGGHEESLGPPRFVSGNLRR